MTDDESRALNRAMGLPEDAANDPNGPLCHERGGLLVFNAAATKDTANTHLATMHATRKAGARTDADALRLVLASANRQVGRR